MALLTLYARRESTTDALSLSFGLGPAGGPAPIGKTTAQLIASGFYGKLDVCLYYDQAATKPAARYSWDSSSKPTRRNKSVMHNCFNYSLAWIDDHLESAIFVPRPTKVAA